MERGFLDAGFSQRNNVYWVFCRGGEGKETMEERGGGHERVMMGVQKA
jgi:hypothetical protein